MSNQARWEALQQVLQCSKSDGLFCTAFEVWTAFRHLTLSQVVQVAEGIMHPNHDNNVYCAFCVTNAMRYYAARGYSVKDIIYTRNGYYVAYLVVYKDTPLCISVFPVILLYFGHIKLSRHDCYFYNTEFVYPE